MLSRFAILLALCACRESLETQPDADETSARVCKQGVVTACVEAELHSDLQWLEANVFKPSCAFNGCHNNAATTAGRIDLMNPGASHADLVNVDSQIETDRKLVVPGQPKQSYLLMLMQQFRPAEMTPPVPPPPSDVMFMPQGTGNAPLCCQKLDAVERWISMGALP